MKYKLITAVISIALTTIILWFIYCAIYEAGYKQGQLDAKLHRWKIHFNYKPENDDNTMRNGKSYNLSIRGRDVTLSVTPVSCLRHRRLPFSFFLLSLYKQFNFFHSCSLLVNNQGVTHNNPLFL